MRPHILIVIKHIFLLLSCYIGNYQLPHFDFIHRFPPDVMLLHKGYEALPVRKLCSPCQPAARRYDRRKRNRAPRNTTCLALISSFNGAVVVSKVMISRFFFSPAKFFIHCLTPCITLRTYNKRCPSHLFCDIIHVGHLSDCKLI